MNMVAYEVIQEPYLEEYQLLSLKVIIREF